MNEGRLLAGRYVLGAVLGRGGMAEVRAGWDRRLGRAVAIKTLLPDLAERPAIRRSFEGEARAAARLVHPHAVAVFDVGEEDGVPFLVMERVSGPTLEHELGGGPLDAQRARRLGGELLAALGAAHAAGVVHRDVKPGNVLMTADGSAKLADFGIAKALEGDGDTGTGMDLTATGQILGTVAYMAPERLAGEPATVRSDLYSVGVVLYEALTGARPFAADTPLAMIRAIDQASPAPLPELCPGLDPALTAAVERAMARNPEDRFAGAAEMSEALETQAPAGATGAGPTVKVALATEILEAPPTAATAAVPSPLQPDRPAGGRSRRRVVALLAVAALAVALIAAVVAGGEDQGSGGTPAGTSPPTTVGTGVPPPGETPTSTSPETTRATAPPEDRGKRKGKD